MITGYVKLFKTILNWEWYSDINTKTVFLHCLLKANYSDNLWRGIVIKRGSFITSIKHLSTELSLSEQKIRTALMKLKSTNEITIETTNKYSVITINNYTNYQDKQFIDNKQNNEQLNNEITNNQQTNNKQITTTNNNKNNKEKKEVPGDDFFLKIIPKKLNNETFILAWNDWVLYRKEIKKRMTMRSAKIQLKFLAEHSNPELVIEQSIRNGWQGLFPLNKKDKSIIENDKPLIIG